MTPLLNLNVHVPLRMRFSLFNSLGPISYLGPNIQVLNNFLFSSFICLIILTVQKTFSRALVIRFGDFTD